MPTPIYKTLFTSEEEVKSHIPIGSIQISQLLPDIYNIEETVIKKLIGSELLADLRTKYNTAIDADINPYIAAPGNLTDAEISALILIQKITAHFAVDRYIVVGQIDIGSDGIGSYAQKKAAWGWQIEEVRNGYLLEKAYNGVDELLEFLEDNAASFTTYDVPSNKDFFINSATEFNQYVSIGNSRRTFQALESIMRKVECFEIEHKIGTALFSWSKALIKNQTADVDNDAILRFIRPAVAHLTVARALVEIPIVLQSDAVVLKAIRPGSGGNAEQTPAPSEFINKKILKLETDGQAYLAKLIRYLNEQASDTRFPEFYNSTFYKGVDSTPRTFNNKKGNSYYGAF